MIRKLLLFFAIIQFAGTFLYSQNSNWNLAPNYWDGGSPNPLPINNGGFPTSPQLYYEGIHAQGSSNMMMDPQGNFLFQVIDGAIYDENANFVDFAWNQNIILDYNTEFGFSQNDVFIEYDLNVYHGQETVIVRHPVNCRQFYIFGSIVKKGHLEYDPGTGDLLWPFITSIPYYALYDMDLNTVIQRGEWFSDSSIPQTVDPNDPIFTNASTQNISYTNGDSPVTVNEYIFQSEKGGGLGLGATPQRPDGSRFICAFLNTHLYVIKIEPNGSLRYWKRYTDFFPGLDYSSKRPEFEIVYDEANDMYKIAAYIGFHDALGDSYGQNIVYAEFDSDMLNKLSHTLTPVVNGGDVHGLEFSPDHSKLYYTKSVEPVVAWNTGIWYIDIANNFDIYGFYGSTNDDFMFSYIETAQDGNLYFATSQGLHRLIDPNNPNQLNFSSTPTIVTPIHESFSGIPTLGDRAKCFNLPDQIDGELTTDMLTESVSCCVAYGSYDQDNYSAATGVCGNVWTPTCNPLNNGAGAIATIKEEFRIPAGVDITIEDMTIQFAPGARLVIENGTSGQEGGKLMLDNTTLTREASCGEYMWLGVEVWGNQNENQGSMNNSTQGRLVMLNQSTIEDAKVGVLLSARANPSVNPFIFDDERNGGIIQAVNSDFHGNQRGLWARKYIAPSQANNLSFIKESNFYWDDLLVENVNPEAHAQIETTKGIRFLGVTFRNMQPDLFPPAYQGVGVLARQSQFYVGISCNTIQPPGTPCFNYAASSFAGLRYGMHVTNSDSRTYTVDRSNFINCVYGIFTKGTRYERITRNHFEVREADYNTAGCAIYGSTGYVIQENDLAEYDDASILHGDGQSYGFVINNSGNSHNLIYKNTFQDLRVGGQSELTNGTIPLFNNVPEGLNWKCNEFNKDIYLADLGINGIIDPWQGELSSISVNDARSKAAGNTFSLYGVNPAIYPYHDIMVYPGSFTQQIKYVHLADLDHTPDNVSPNVTPILSTFMTNPVYSDQNTCPSLLDQKPIVIKPKILQVQQALETEKEKLDGGNTAELLDLIAYESNENLVKNTLLDKSPFLTDEVLLAYLVSDAPSGMIKDVLIENSHLSDTVLLAVSNSSLPNGTKNQIMAVQSGESQRTLLYYTIHALNSEYKDLYNDLVSQYLNDGSAQALSELKDLLSQLGDLESKKLLLDVHVDEDELSQADQLKNQLMSVYNDADFYNLHDIKYDVRNTPAVDVALDDQPQLVYDLEYLSDFAFSEHISERAQSILELKFGKSEVPAFLPLFAGSAMMMYNDETNEESSDLQTHWQVVSMYPNPSSGIVTFDFPEAEAGDLLIQIISLDGKTMEELKAENTNGERMDLSHLKNGFYIVKISIDGVMLAPQKLEIHR